MITRSHGIQNPERSLPDSTDFIPIQGKDTFPACLHRDFNAGRCIGGQLQGQMIAAIRLIDEDENRALDRRNDSGSLLHRCDLGTDPDSGPAWLERLDAEEFVRQQASKLIVEPARIVLYQLRSCVALSSARAESASPAS